MKSLLLCAALVARPIVSEDILEPSVRNEVDHAIACAYRHLAELKGSATNDVAELSCSDPFATNGLSATRLALSLVSRQKADGSWTVGTNDCTRLALEILESLP